MPIGVGVPRLECIIPEGAEKGETLFTHSGGSAGFGWGGTSTTRILPGSAGDGGM